LSFIYSPSELLHSRHSGPGPNKIKKRNPNSEPRFSLPSLAHIEIVDRGYFYHVQSELTAFVDVRTTTDGLGFGGGGLVHTSFIVPLKNTKSKAAPGSVWMRVMLRKKKSRKNCLCTTSTKRNKLECSSRGAEISAFWILVRWPAFSDVSGVAG